jgi:hypothetical protein
VSSEVLVGSRLLLLLSLDLLRADYLPSSSGPRDHKAGEKHALYAKSRWMDGQTRSSESKREGRLYRYGCVYHMKYYRSQIL